jgi:tetratricopeptide (TPR) repeat protein/tRNA A-37 threonylcarbamoyl transferase component Bud32
VVPSYDRAGGAAAPSVPPSLDAWRLGGLRRVATSVNDNSGDDGELSWGAGGAPPEGAAAVAQADAPETDARDPRAPSPSESLPTARAVEEPASQSLLAGRPSSPSVPVISSAAPTIRETFGRYTLLEKIGEGGMAEVFRAKSYGVEGFEKVLVIKRILPDLAREPRFVEMFVREAKLSVRLSHANVVQVFDLGRVSGALFIAMEYVHGLDLATLLGWLRRRGRKLPVSIAAYVAAEVAKGLDHAHRRRDEQLRPLGIVHRDVSPQNVLLSYEGEVKVTDFGIAKARDTLGRDDDDGPRSDGKIAIRGKFAYLAPEQVQGISVDARCDIWALGVVLYEMATGTNPFAAGAQAETLRRVRTAEFPPLELAEPDLPREFTGIVRRALALSPEARYPDAARLHDELLAFLYTSGERFGAHALGELLAEVRAGRDEPIEDAPAAFVEEGLVRTPVEVPEPDGVPTVPPRALAHPPSIPEIPAPALPRATVIGEHREVTALLVAEGAFDPPSERRTTRASGERGPRDIAESLLRHYGATIVDAGPGQLAGLFGAEIADGRDTEIAVRCAMVIARALREPAPNAAIGVHAAKVVISRPGEVEPDDRLRALLSGAQELARAREGRIALSTAALRHVRSGLEVEPIPDAARTLASVSGVLVKGRRPASELYAKFVGRREELRVLGEILAAATRRRARLVTIRGAAGIGKTRLLHEVHRRLQRGAYNVGWYLAACTPHGRDVPLAGVAAMLRVLCGIEEGDPESKLAAVRPRLRALGLGDDDLRTVLELVRAGGDLGTGDAGSTQEHAAAALAHMISRLCDDRLHVLAWDDVQAIDAASLAVLSSVAKAVVGCRVVLLFAALAIEEREDAGGVVLHAELEAGRAVSNHLVILRPLGQDEIRKVVATRLSVREVAPELLTFVAERTAGNPLYVEELVRAMQEAGAVTKIVLDPGDPAAARPALERAVFRRGGESVDLPKSLRGLVASRFAKLSARERTILTAVALLGEPAEIDLLVATLEPRGASSEDTGGVAGLERALGPLESARILRRVGERSVAFGSPVAREIVLDAAPAEAKRDLHGAIAAALMAQPSPPSDRIALHLLESGDRERAATFFARSGETHLAGGHPESAARDLARAVILGDVRLRGRDEILRLLRGLAIALGTARGGRGQGATDATTAIERALARLDGETDPRLRRDAWIEAGRAFGAISAFDKANEAFDRAEALATDGDRSLQRVLMARAELARRRGTFGEAARILERLEPMVAQSGDSKELYDVFVGLASAHAAIGGEENRAHAFAYVDRADRVASAIGDGPVLEVERAKVRALVCYFVRDYRTGAEWAQRAADLARGAGLLYETAINLHNVGDCRIRCGDRAGAYAALRQSLALAEEGGHDRLVAINRAPLAYLDALAGDASARRRLGEVVAWSHQRGYAWDELNARYWLALSSLEVGERADAIAELARARAIAERLSMRAMVADCDAATVRARR